MAAADLLPYALYTDAPGVLFIKPEWEAANASHAPDTDFGTVPYGWPAHLDGRRVWSGAELKDEDDLYIRVVSDKEIDEVHAALETWKGLSLPLASLSRSTFQLPRFGPVLQQLADNIYNGIGVQILRGFPIQRYDKEDQLAVFLGINAWIGDQRLDQGAGRGICHIKSITHIDPANRGKVYVSAQDTNPQMYHSDAGSDVVGLLAISVPQHGGKSTVASSWQVYNHLAKHRPDILRILAERRFRWQANGIPADGVRLIHWKDEKLFLNFSTRTFIGYGEVPDRDHTYPALTYEEREAFGGWQWVAEQFSLQTELQTGDFEWVNNLYLQHARHGFKEDPASPRHLLRVWLRDTKLSPELPLDIKNKFETMFANEPDFFPADELEEDLRRRQTGVFTASCDAKTTQERLDFGGIEADNNSVHR